MTDASRSGAQPAAEVGLLSEQLETELCLEVGDPISAGRRQVVSVCERGAAFWGEGPRSDHLPELPEVVLEAGRRDDLEDPRGLIGWGPERVRYVARLDDVRARPAQEEFVSDPGTDRALDHEGIFVLVAVHVGRNQPTGLDGVLHDRETATGLSGVDLELDPETSKVDTVPLAWRNDDGF